MTLPLGYELLENTDCFTSALALHSSVFSKWGCTGIVPFSVVSKVEWSGLEWRTDLCGKYKVSGLYCRSGADCREDKTLSKRSFEL